MWSYQGTVKIGVVISLCNMYMYSIRLGVGNILFLCAKLRFQIIQCIKNLDIFIQMKANIPSM